MRIHPESEGQEEGIFFMVYTLLGKETQTHLLGRDGQGEEEGREGVWKGGRGRKKGRNYIEIDIKCLCFLGAM